LIGVQAVDVFFVLSGFVIAHVYATRERDLRTYVVARAARIYSVAIPALILTVVLDFIGAQVSDATDPRHNQGLYLGLIIRSLLFIGERWNDHRIPGSNVPYWSLGFEVWYYIAFGVFAFSPNRWRWLATLAVFAFIGPKVVLMFPIWLMGFGTYHLSASLRLPKVWGWVLYAVSISLIVIYQQVPHSRIPQYDPVSLDPFRIWTACQDYLIGALFSIHLLGFATVSGTFSAWLEAWAKPIRWIAGATFSIYLAHLPIMFLLSAISPWPKHSLWTLALLLTVTPAACFLFAEVSERRKDIWRRWLERGVDMAETIIIGLRRRLQSS
jgi:peptidoglycan/LPS O-acetylase OafA/YrhL